VAAVLELVGEGDRVPTAERVAERAGVGIRTVFRHFSDMDSLYSAMSDWVRQQADPYMAVPPIEGSLAERIEQFVEVRSSLMERLAPYFRSDTVLRWKSDFLQKQYRNAIRGQREHLLTFFPELRNAPPDVLEAADCASSLETWERLRSCQNLSRSRAAAVRQRTLASLLEKVIE